MGAHFLHGVPTNGELVQESCFATFASHLDMRYELWAVEAYVSSKVYGSKSYIIPHLVRVKVHRDLVAQDSPIPPKLVLSQ